MVQLTQEEPSAKRPRIEKQDDVAAPLLGVIAGKEGTFLNANIDHVTAKAQEIDHVVFHGRCPDGFTAAYAAWLALGDRASYIGIGHGSRADKAKTCGDVAGKHVAVLDFSFDAPTTKEQLAVAASLVVLDHHASAESSLKDVPDVNKVFEMKQSGATLAWNFFHPGKECPLLFRYIEDKDIWRWAMHNSKEFSAAFELAVPIPECGHITCKDFLELDRLVKGGEPALAALIEKGGAVLQFQNQIVIQHKKRAVLRRLKAFPELRAAVVNATVLPSEIGNACTQIEGANFALVYSAQADGKGFSISARSCFPSDGQADVSLIAKHFGGGGHRAASGFRIQGETIEAILTPFDLAETTPGAKDRLAELEAFAQNKAHDTLDFPADISNVIRKLLHDAAEKLGLKHVSVGTGDERFLQISRAQAGDSTQANGVSARHSTMPDSSTIVRKGVDDPRMSQIVEHNGVVYLTGQVGDIDKLEQSDCREQVRQTLAKVDALLLQAGSSKSKVLSAQLWLKDIERDFAMMNEVWNEWVDPANKGTRACVQSSMARPSILFEVSIVAAK